MGGGKMTTNQRTRLFMAVRDVEKVLCQNQVAEKAIVAKLNTLRYEVNASLGSHDPEDVRSLRSFQMAC
jgi:hypothetical protein